MFAYYISSLCGHLLCHTNTRTVYSWNKQLPFGLLTDVRGLVDWMVEGRGKTISYCVPAASAMMRGSTQACTCQLTGLGTSAICETLFQLYEQNIDVIT